jgi:hypothetical protein
VPKRKGQHSLAQHKRLLQDTMNPLERMDGLLHVRSELQTYLLLELPLFCPDQDQPS